MQTVRSKSHRRRIGQEEEAEAWSPASPTTDGGVDPSQWYRSDDAYQDAARTTPCASDGDPIGSWTDKSANADHLPQANPANKPSWENGVADQLNGHPVTRYPGGKSLHGDITDITQPLTAICVAHLDASVVQDGNNRTIFDGNTWNDRCVLMQIGSSNKWDIFAGANLGHTLTDADWHIFVVLFNGASSKVWIDGVQTHSGNAGTYNQTELTVGARYPPHVNFLIGEIAELLFYNSDLSDADKNQLGEYASGRYALNWTTIA